MTIITDKLENSSTGYSLKAVKGLIQHLKDEGWSFAYMGTDHDMDGVTVSLSIHTDFFRDLELAQCLGTSKH